MSMNDGPLRDHNGECFGCDEVGTHAPECPRLRGARAWRFPDQALGVVILTELEILAEYYPYWAEQMIRVGKADQISEASCIEDWAAVHWAEPYTAPAP